MKLVLLDRDGVIVVNRATNIKTPGELALVKGAAEGIRRLNEAGFRVAVCTNQPEVGRGAMTAAQLDEVHVALLALLESEGARVDRIFSCVSVKRCPQRKPSPGMLREALLAFGAAAEDTPFVGDQADDLKAGFRAGCPRLLVRTGLGAKALATGLPGYLRPYSVHDDLRTAAEAIVHNVA